MDSYLICATPRTGSTLLCGLLESTGVAGHPESYFRQPDEQVRAAQWGIGRSDGAFSYSDYVRAALSVGRTENGVFAARIMWGTLDEVVAKLATVYSERAGSDLSLLERAFGDTRFVYLRRRDVVGQAVSWSRAEQTNVWAEDVRQARKEPGREPRYEFNQIHWLVQLIAEHNAAWQDWFASAGVRPYLVEYEELEADPVGITRGVLGFLGLELPTDRVIVPQHRRQADELSASWIERYKLEVRGLAGGVTVAPD